MADPIKPIIRHNQYEKIVDDMMIIGDNAIIRFNVLLAKYNSKFGRTNYHQEFEYYNKDAGMNTVTLRRNFDYYFSLENIRIDQNTPIKQFIMITVNDIAGFQLFLNDIMRWFDDPEYEGLFVKNSKKNQIVMTKQVKPLFIDLPPGNSYIVAEPMICINRYNEETIGVRLYLASESNYVEVPLNKMRGLKYLIDRTDMYGAALSLINYLQRPEYGTNLISYSRSNKDYNAEVSTPTQQSGRKINPKSNNPRLEDLEEK